MMILSVLLLCASAIGPVMLFSSSKLYHLHSQPDLVSSPHAAFVPAELNREPLEKPSLLWRALSWIAFQSSVFWRFLFNLKPPGPRCVNGAHTELVQRLAVWSPGELELHLLAIYSPAHSLVWMIMDGSNWILITMIFVFIGFQVILSSDDSMLDCSQTLVIDQSSHHKLRTSYQRQIDNLRRSHARV